MKTVNGVTTFYLVDTNNHTGYVQVVEELQSNVGVVKQFTFGHDLISQRITGASVSFYNYDGHGSVRQLTNQAGAITDTYTFDAFGNLINRTGTTPNDYLYAGEQFDANLGFYYLRARYMNPSNGRFHSMDSYEGSVFEPKSLHKYLYASNNPVNRIDPSGYADFSLSGISAALGNMASIAAMSVMRFLPVAQLVGYRFAYWIFANQVKIDFYWTALSIGASVFLDASTRVLLNNEESVQLQPDGNAGNPGDWVEKKIGANANDYEIIDDFRDGNATSVKSNYQNMQRLMDKIHHDASELGNHNSDFQPRNAAPSTVKPIPLSSVQTRTLLMIIPENHAAFLRDPAFIQRVRQIQQSTRTAINVVPLRGWRK